MLVVVRQFWLSSTKIIGFENFSEIREGARELTLEYVKEILRTEVRKSILFRVSLSGHNAIYDSMRKVESIGKIYDILSMDFSARSSEDPTNPIF